MGDKLDGLKATLGRLKKDDPAVRGIDRMVNLLSPEHAAQAYYIPDTDPIEYVLPTDTLELGEEVLRLRGIKTLVAALEKATNEYVSEVELKLHEAMSTRGPVGFSTHSGYRFAMTSQSIVQAKKELGGTSNPEIKAWLLDNGMPDIAAGSINATSYKSAVGKWLDAHPIEAVKQVGDDNVILEGAELLEALGLQDIVEVDDAGNERTITAQEQYEHRVAEHERLLATTVITKQPAISVTKL